MQAGKCSISTDGNKCIDSISLQIVKGFLSSFFCTEFLAAC